MGPNIAPNISMMGTWHVTKFSNAYLCFHNKYIMGKEHVTNFSNTYLCYDNKFDFNDLCNKRLRTFFYRNNYSVLQIFKIYIYQRIFLFT